MPPKKKKKVKKQQAGDGIYQTIANRVFGANLGKDEYHAPQYTANGFKFGSYIGPGTDVYNNIRKGKKPVSETDKISLKHDLAYGKARSAKDVRAADLKMVNKLKETQKNKTDYKFNILMGRLPIQAKMWAEDRGIIRQGAFADFDEVPEADRKVSDAKFNELEQQGYGKKKKSKWLIHVASIRKKNPNVPYKECLKIASASYNKE